MNDEELEEGVYAVGVSVLDGRGSPAASLGIANFAFHNSLKDLELARIGSLLFIFATPPHDQISS